MTECADLAMQEALPLLRLGRLPAAEAARVQAHAAACASCAAELAMLERSAAVFAAATPAVDIAAIVAKLPVAPSATAAPSTRGLRVERGGGAGPTIPRSVLAAAASVTLVATLSFAALQGRVFGGATPSGAGLDSGAALPAPVAVSLVGAVELADLGSAELEALLAELDGLEATVAAEPSALQRPVVAAPEGM